MRFDLTQAGYLKVILAEAREDELAFMLQGSDKVHNGWLPFQLADFISILSECMIEMNGPVMLEVGSGIGTKMLVAREMFGLTTFGIEYNESLATISEQKHRGKPWVGDALSFPYGYNNYDFIWLYRPFKDPELESSLEDMIYTQMKPGAIFAGAHLDHLPEGWITVVDDTDIGLRGAWKKPLCLREYPGWTTISR